MHVLSEYGYGPRARGRERRGVFYFIAGGLYSVTALRENDQERVTVYKVYFFDCWYNRGCRGCERGRGERKRFRA